VTHRAHQDDGAVVVPRAGGGLLAVHAHPDDETLTTGALLATWAAAGLPVTVVTCTRGERGEAIGEQLEHLVGDGPALAARRTRELAGALAALGVGDHVWLDEIAPAATARYEDSGMAWLAPGVATGVTGRPPGAFVEVDLEVAAGRVARLLRDRRPEVVVGYEPGGGYGHPDHVKAHRVMTRAVELAAQDADDDAGWRVPVVLWSVLEAEALRDGYAACARVLAGSRARAGVLGTPDPDGGLPSAAVGSELVDVRVAVAPVRASLVAALTAHASQVTGVQPGVDGVELCYALSNGVLLPVLAEETYRIVRQLSPVRWPGGLRVP